MDSVPPVTMKVENAVDVLTLSPATMLRMGTYSEPPPTPPALEMVAAKKERTHARTVRRLLCDCKEDSMAMRRDPHGDW